MELTVGQIFESASEAIDFVTNFAKNHFHPLRQRHNVSVESYNKKVSDDKKLSLTVKYKTVHWECKHFGVYKPTGKGKRSIVHTFAAGCSFNITISYNRAMARFMVTNLDLEHKNHDISAELFSLYPDQRKPTGRAAEEADQMLQVNGNPTLVTQMLHKQGFNVTRKDVYNMKRRLASTGLALITEIETLLATTNSQYKIIKNEQNEFEMLFMQTPLQKELFRKYGEVLQFDATYKTNKFLYPLFTLLVEDGNGMGQPVAFGVLAKEDEGHVAAFLRCFGDFNNMHLTQAVVTDKDQAEMNAVAKTWPRCRLILCYFHVLRAIDRHLVSCHQYSSDDRNRCCELAKLFLNARSQRAFDESVELMKTEQPAFYGYIETNWIPYAQSIVLFQQMNLRLMNNRTNNRLESFHDTLKKVLPSSRVTLPGLIQTLLSIMDVRSMEGAHKNFQATMKRAVLPGRNTTVQSYYDDFTLYCARLIESEFLKAQENTYVIKEEVDVFLLENQKTGTEYQVVLGQVVTCSCCLLVTVGIPCRHIFAVLVSKGENCFCPNLVAARWKKTNREESGTGQVESEQLEQTVEVATFGPSSATRGSRFQTSMVLMKELASFVADQRKDLFPQYLECMDEFKKLIFAGEVRTVLELLRTLSSAAETNQTPAAVDVSFNPTDTPTDVVSGIVIEEDGHDLSVPNPPSPPKALETVVFRPIPKARGRPAQVRQRAFRVFGKKKVPLAAPESSLSHPDAAPTVPSSAPEPARTPPESDASITASTAASGNCAECGRMDPPREVSAAKKVRWIQCDTCLFWYHRCCVKAYLPPKQKAPTFNCERCLRERKE